MTFRKELKIAIIEDDENQFKVYSKYISEICTRHGKKMDCQLKHFENYHSGIEELEDDLDVMLLSTDILPIPGKDDLDAENVIESVENNAEDCEIILMSKDIESAINLKYKYDDVTAAVDMKSRDYFYLGKLMQGVLKKHNESLGPRKVM